MKSLLTFLAALCVLPYAMAQDPHSAVRILVYGADTVAQCAAPITALQSELPTLPFPSGWTIGIVCNPVAWQEIVQIADPPHTNNAFTNLKKHSTVVNAGIFRGPRWKYRHTLAHELGHAVCMCAGEERAETVAKRHQKLDRVLVQARLPEQTAGHGTR